MVETWWHDKGATECIGSQGEGGWQLAATHKSKLHCMQVALVAAHLTLVTSGVVQQLQRGKVLHNTSAH